MGHFQVDLKPRFQIEAKCKTIFFVHHYLNKNCARGLVLKVRVLELGRLTESDKIFTLVEQDVLWAV